VVELFFGYFSIAVVLFSLLVVLSKNPVHSVLWMLVLFFHIAGIFLLLNAEFLAATQIIVYAGAILVLFLFVIMLLNLRQELTLEQWIDGWPAGLSIALAVLIMLILSVGTIAVKPVGPWSIEAVKKVTQTKAFGKVLYTEYLLPFEVASLILLVAIIGAVVLAKKKLKS